MLDVQPCVARSRASSCRRDRAAPKLVKLGLDHAVLRSTSVPESWTSIDTIVRSIEVVLRTARSKRRVRCARVGRAACIQPPLAQTTGMSEPSWKAGDCFAFIAEPETTNSPGDVLYGEVLAILSIDRFRVRVYCESEAEPGIEVYESGCLTERLSRAAMDRAAAANYPPEVAWLRQLLAN